VVNFKLVEHLERGQARAYRGSGSCRK